MQMNNFEVSQIWKSLKMKNPQVQEEAAIKLYEYLQKHSEDTDDIFDHFRVLLESPKKEEKFGIFLALNKILGISRETQIVHYVNKLIPVLLNQLTTNNPELVEKGAECLGNLAEAGGSITAEVIDKSLNTAIIWLSQDTNPRSTDIKKYSAVLILREYSRKLSVITFNKLFDTNNNFRHVFRAFADNREKVRNIAAEVINECIKQIAERQQKRGHFSQTQLIYAEVEKAFEQNDPNFQHAALSVIATLISSHGTKNEIISQQNKGSVIVKEVMNLLKNSRNALVKKRCIEVIPALYKYIKDHFNKGDNLDTAMKAILEFIRTPGNKDRGQGFISIGKMSGLVDHALFMQYIDPILFLIHEEVRVPPRGRDGLIKPFADLDSLTCMKYLLRSFGKELKEKIDMYALINDIFYTGYNRQVIECLGEISKICRGEFKRAAQIKLLNSCSIILTQKRDQFPLTLEDQFLLNAPEENQAQSNKSDGRLTGRSSGPMADKRRNSDEESKTFERESMQFGTMIENEDNAYDDKRKKAGNLTDRDSLRESSSANNKQKKILKDFYQVVLNKENQKFLHELVKQSNLPTAQDSNNAQNSTTERTKMVTLALRTLQMFDFDALAMCIVYFIENSVLNYLDDENPMVRKEAMQTCCGLSFPQNDRLRISAGMERIINKLLHKFFVTATTDNEDRIRVTMLKYLNPQFDPFISKYENLLMLFNCMQDQNYEIKERTVRILGRLVPHNAAQILPYLRQLIISLISQLEQSNDTKEREEAVRLIKIFVKYAPDLSRAYSTSILKCLIKKLDGERAKSTFVSAILNVISEISKINSEAIKPYLGELFPLILECIKDFSSTIKRQQAIQTLISIIENTGFVVKPYFYFPEILSTISNLVQTEQQQEIHKLIFRLIGTLGAVDPYLVKQIKLSSDIGSSDVQELPNFLQLDENDAGMKKIRCLVSSDQKNKGKQGEIILAPSAALQVLSKLLVPIDELSLSKENKYPAMAIHQLLKVLVDPNLRDHHKVCLDGIKYLVRNQPDCMPFMPMLIPPLMHLMKQNELQLTESLFSCLQMIIQFVPEAMIKFADPIFEMINQVIHQQTIPVIKLLAEINLSYKNKLFSHMYLVLPKVLQIIEESRRQAELYASTQMIQSLEMIRVTKEAVIQLPTFDYQILDDHLYLIVPLLLRTASRKFIHTEISNLNKVAVKTLNEMVNCSTFREHTAQVVHQLLRILESQEEFDQDLIDEIIGSFCKIAGKLTSDFAPYIGLIQKAFKRNRLQDKCTMFDLTIKQITKLDPIDQFQHNLESPSIQQTYDEANSNVYLSGVSKDRNQRIINNTDLLREFDTSKCHILDDWNEWLKKTSHKLLKQNPSAVLFACSTLTEVYAPLATELYNIAFVSCWKNMHDSEKRIIMNSFQAAILSKTKTTQVLQTILNLAEFMELDENADIKLFSAKTLAKIAENCNAYAKALYYWEQEFDNNPKETIELLIQTNYGLQQPEAAEGILEYAKKNNLLEGTEDWYEKLQKWPEALKIYEKKQITEQNYHQVHRGKLNCYRNLMDWEKLSVLIDDMWNDHLSAMETDHKTKTKGIIREHAQDAAYAAWNLGKWEDFKRYSRYLDSQVMEYENCFFSAVLEIQQKQYTQALKHIDKAREVLNSKITSLLGESYNRAYQQIKELQYLKELEEVIEYKRTISQEKRINLYKCWVNRQKSMPSADLEAHQMILNIRCLVIDKKDEVENFIQFAKMAQESHNSNLCSRLLVSLKKELQKCQETLNQEEKKQGMTAFVIQQEQKKLRNNMAKVEMAISDQLYSQGNPGSEESFQRATNQLEIILTDTKDIDADLISQCYQKLSSWQFEFLEANKQILEIKDEDYKKIVDNCAKATQINPSNAEAWHIFSTTNDQASIYCSKKFSREFRGHAQLLGLVGKINSNEAQQTQYLLHREFGHNFLPKLLAKKFHPLASSSGFDSVHSLAQDLARKYVFHVTSAVKGLVQQLFLSAQTLGSSSTKTLQTTLRLLKIWFQHGNLNEIEQNLKQGFEKIDLKVWIEVIPQLLARIDINDIMIKQTLIELIEKISMKFPQALIYSLSVTQKSTTEKRRQAADQLIEKLKTTQPVLIEQAQIISNELNRSAILLCEVWKEAIEEASRIYFERNEPKAMYQYIIPFHRDMEKEPETMNEIAFYQGYASDLLDAFSWMQRYIETENLADINLAWDIYYSIFRKISTKQKEVQFYELRNVAPKLLNSENLEIAVPGTFKSNKPIVKISKFAPILPVLASKQHPRRMSMLGSDGRDYLFLLKGHEDLRQDERVMQLFGLVNTLLSIDDQTSKKDLTIKKYPVIPLSQNTGLIGWVQNCDTLHILIKEHREENNIIPNIEYKLMEQMCEHFDICPLPNKVEIFRNALEKTLGEDIQKVLWVKSQNSEVWLERRTNYTRSLAVMSMVGYILGLGDRHPSNIMLERYTGKIVHIDFGDCFEIAMRREKFPEKIPFRLTRMLIRAMEVSGIEGNFRTTCENTMRVMRDNKESLLAIMEAFVNDPLLSFRLLNPEMFKKHKQDEHKDGENKKIIDVQQIKKEAEQEPVDLVAEIEKNKQVQIREKIVDSVLDRLQGQQHQDKGAMKLQESKFSRHVEDNELRLLMQNEEEDLRQDELNQIAEIVIQRIQDKLRGLEFHNPNKPTDREQRGIGVAANKQNLLQQRNYQEQVDILIKQATCHENLASCYIGWCPYW